MLKLLPFIVALSIATVLACASAYADPLALQGGPRNWGLRLAQADPCNCNSTLKTRVATCNTIFPPASRSSEHTACLQKARDEFDACRKAC